MPLVVRESVSNLGQEGAQEVVVHDLHHEAEALRGGAYVSPDGPADAAEDLVRQLVRAHSKVLEEVEHVHLLCLVVEVAGHGRGVDDAHINALAL